MKLCKRKYRWIFVSILVVFLIAAVLIAFFSVNAARHRVLSFHSLNVNDELYSYWQMRFRYEYIIAHNSEGAADTDAFWNTVKDSSSGLTYAADCAAVTDKMIAEILIASSLFDTNYSLTSAQRTAIESSLDARLSFFDNDKKSYNEQAEKYGFTYKSAQRAAVYEAKANLLASYSTASDAQKEAYYRDNYVRVKMVFVKTDHLHGADTLATLRAGLTSGVDSTQFDRWVNDSNYNDDTGAETYPGGYYFAPDSAFTEEYRSLLPDVVDAVFTLTKESPWAEVKCDDGIRFLYLYNLPETPAYEDSENATEGLFTDLLRDASNYYLMQWIDSYLAEVMWNTAAKPTPIAHGYPSDLYRFFQ